MKRSRSLAIADDGPITRGDCETTREPCTRIRCRFNLFSADLLSDDRISVAGHVLASDATAEQIDDAAEALAELARTRPSCVLDLIDKHHEMTLEQIGQTLGCTRERVRQIEWKALRHLPRSLIRSLGVQREEFHESTAPERERAFRRPSR